jgi:CubicO group peptidase (beta-lactamase class C family)
MPNRAQIDRALQQKADTGKIPGVVAVATTGTDVIYQGAFGKRDLGKTVRMTEDSVFWIASMTKAITTAGAMQLVEQGRLSLDEPIGRVLPDLASPHVLDGFDASGKPILRPAKGAITLRHLLTHTSGYCLQYWNHDMRTYVESRDLPEILSCKADALKLPLVFDPGTRWEYGIGLDFVGKVIEAVSGLRLDAYLHDNIIAPLGMSDTAFKLGKSQRDRLVTIHSRGENGLLTPIQFELEQEPEFLSGGSGLYSTASDYIRFVRMILNKGRGNGNRLLKPETIEAMGQNHIGQIEVTRLPTEAPNLVMDIDFFPEISKKWGLGFMINMAAIPEGRSAGSLSWAGAANTHYWIDPSREIAGVIMMQVLPFCDEICLSACSDFERGIYLELKTILY